MNELINEADEVPMPKRAPPKAPSGLASNFSEQSSSGVAPNPEPVFMSMPGNMAPVGLYSRARGETTVQANTTIKRFKAPLPKEHLYTFEDESLFRVKADAHSSCEIAHRSHAQEKEMCV